MADPTPNRPGSLPRVPGGPALALRRSHFLDGTQLAFYGPGQPPDSGVQPGFDSDGNPVAKVYQPPMDWSRAGAPLRVPQVVFLTARRPPAAGPVLASYDYRDSIVQASNSIAYTDCEGVRKSCSPEYTNHAYRRLTLTGTFAGPDLGRAEYDRLRGVFAEVKAMLEGLRGGRTWVDVLDWEDDDDAPAYGMDDTIDFLLAPPGGDGNGPYFGVDFLHVYAGVPRGTIDGVRADLSGMDAAIPEDELVAWTASAGRVVAASGRFAGYAALVYAFRSDGVGLDWHANDTVDPVVAAPSVAEFTRQYDSVGGSFTTTDCDPPPNIASFTFTLGALVPSGSGRPDPYTTLAAYPGPTPIPAAGTIYDTDDPPVPGPGEYFVPAGGDPTAILIASVPGPGTLRESYRAGLDFQNDLEQFRANVMGAMCAPLAGQGVDFRGASDVLDTAGLVALIADHYGFDPRTGADLP